MKKNCRKRVIASVLVIGAMAGGVGMVSGQMVSATESGDEKSESSNHKKPELSEEKKAEIKEKLDAMTEEERKEWRENHRHKKDEQAEDSSTEAPAEK